VVTCFFAAFFTPRWVSLRRCASKTQEGSSVNHALMLAHATPSRSFVMKTSRILSTAIACIALSTHAWAADTESTPARNAQIDHFVVGKKAVDDKKWSQAVDAFNKVVAANPKNADAYNYLGFSYRWMDKYPEAFAAYGKALALDPNHKGALNYSGIAYLKSGQRAKAEEQLQRLQNICASCEETAGLSKALSEASAGK
jgi:Flp pilus assembly protein TadD